MSGRALRFTPSAENDLRRLDPPIRKRVLGARLRVGDWRVIFDYDRKTETVLIRHVLPRSRAYER